jgi:hypothetical protein
MQSLKTIFSLLVVFLIHVKTFGQSMPKYAAMVAEKKAAKLSEENF